jgi:hypothetical protein
LEAKWCCGVAVLLCCSQKDSVAVLQCCGAAVEVRGGRLEVRGKRERERLRGKRLEVGG